ncbi:MAG: hypothetical protein ACI9BH_003362, partial [Paracoccaceae bacterium]
FTIQPPPLTGIYKVPVSGSLFAWEPEKDIRQAVLPKYAHGFFDHRVTSVCSWSTHVRFIKRSLKNLN